MGVVDEYDKIHEYIGGARFLDIVAGTVGDRGALYVLEGEGVLDVSYCGATRRTIPAESSRPLCSPWPQNLQNTSRVCVRASGRLHNN